jgi:nucleoside-diphosphate-sugar epimerase
VRVLVTGATGFVGRALVPVLIAAGHDVAVTVRQTPIPPFSDGVMIHEVADIGPGTDWTEVLNGIDAVVHLAGRVHVMKEHTANGQTEFDRINASGTEHLARAAASVGVRRFVYMSTVKVMGDATQATPFSETDTPAPEDTYGASKLAGEQALARIAEQTNLEPVILRPPLVYGPGAKGNMLSLLKLCRLAPSLPLGRINNQRSLIFVENLADAVCACLENPKAAREIFFVRDGEDLSSSDLIRRVSGALNRPVRLFALPPVLLRLAGRMTGKSLAVERLLGSLQVNDEKIRSQLAWTPPFNVVQGLDKMAAWFKNS